MAQILQFPCLDAGYTHRLIRLLDALDALDVRGLLDAACREHREYIIGELRRCNAVVPMEMR